MDSSDNGSEATQELKDRIRRYRAYIAEMPNHSLGWYNLAMALEEARRYSEAKQAMSRALALSPTLRDALPQRWKDLLGLIQPDDELSTQQRAEARVGSEVAGHRVDRVHAVSESQALYDAVELQSGDRVTLREVLDMPAGSRRAALEQEMQISHKPLGLLDVSRVIEAGDHAPMQVLPRLRATTFTDLMRSGALDYDVIARMMRSVALIVHELHDHALIHGDLRPDHVLRDDTSPDDRVFLLGARGDLTTRSGEHLPSADGRLQWMSPEEGFPDAFDNRTDVYGLGLLLYAMLTGHPPPSLPVRLQGRVPAAVTGATWSGLDDIVWRCLETDPSDRYQSAEEVARALGELIDKATEQANAPETGPRVIGNWRLDEIIGEGSFGAVYAARSTSAVSRTAAVKLLHPHMARDPEQRRRFLNEAIAASQVEHPNIVAIYDGDVLDDETCYIAMERLDGDTLDQVSGQGALDVGRAARLGRQIASALAAAHRANIVHRDLKPGNIMVTRSPGNDGFVKVLDFGIATLRGQPTAAAGPFTSTGRLWGTPAYMAPEQWSSDAEVDGRADVYALGVILHECLTGEHPFAGATSMWDWQQAHTGQAPPPLGDEVPAELAALVQRMMAKQPDERPDAAEVAGALDAFTGKQRVIHRISHRVPWPWILGAAAAAVMVAGVLIYALWPSPPAGVDESCGDRECKAGLECRAGVCELPGEGSACYQGRRCDDGLVCEDGVCRAAPPPLAGLGEDCGVAGCKAGLWCGADRVCALPAQGQPCYQGTLCAQGLVCGDDAMCRAPGVFEMCAGVCAQGLVCESIAGAGKVCLRRDGQACQHGAECASAHCALPAGARQGVCAARPSALCNQCRPGSPLCTNDGCKVGNICFRGRCMSGSIFDIRKLELDSLGARKPELLSPALRRHLEPVRGIELMEPDDDRLPARDRDSELMEPVD